MPELNPTTGMPASVAVLTARRGVRVTSGRDAIDLAVDRILDQRGLARHRGSLEYFRSMLSLAAAACAPERILSQKVSPGVSWVIIAMV